MKVQLLDAKFALYVRRRSRLFVCAINQTGSRLVYIETYTIVKKGTYSYLYKIQKSKYLISYEKSMLDYILEYTQIN